MSIICNFNFFVFILNIFSNDPFIWKTRIACIYLCVTICLSACLGGTCHGTHVEVRGYHIVGAGSPLPCWFQGLNSNLQVWQQSLNPWNHLASPGDFKDRVLMSLRLVSGSIFSRGWLWPLRARIRDVKPVLSCAEEQDQGLHLAKQAPYHWAISWSSSFWDSALPSCLDWHWAHSVAQTGLDLRFSCLNFSSTWDYKPVLQWALPSIDRTHLKMFILKCPSKVIPIYPSRVAFGLKSTRILIGVALNCKVIHLSTWQLCLPLVYWSLRSLASCQS